MPTVTRSLAWVPASHPGFEGATVTISPRGSIAVGHITAEASAEAGAYDVDYRIECDEAWRTRHVQVTESLTSRSVELWSTGDGHWHGDDGRLLLGLMDAIDVDLSATPFSNTLPVRRLGLALGQSADIVAAYIDIPSLRVSADRQRYTRTGPSTYRYSSIDGSFMSEVEVDDEGFVVEYPGLFSRVGR